MTVISDRQEEMLAFIEDFVMRHGYPPTHEEIRTGLKISTKSLVNYHLEALENAALLTRVPNTPRGIKLNCAPDTVQLPFGALTGPSPEPAPSMSPAEVIELTYNIVTNDNNLYALKVDGTILMDASMSPGDTIILQRQNQARNGELVAARLLDRNKIALRRYFRENGHVRLQAARFAAGTIVVAPDAVEIQGKVVAVIRQSAACA